MILLASQCEDLFRQSEDEADLASFHVHLRAWKNTCATLAEHRHNNSKTVDQIPSVPVYTARDVVERATNIVLEMERLSKENPDSTIVPDVTSYNILIGAYIPNIQKVCVYAPAFDWVLSYHLCRVYTFFGMGVHTILFLGRCVGQESSGRCTHSV